MEGGFITETAVYDLPHKGYVRTRTVQSVVKNTTLLILSANEHTNVFTPLTSLTTLANMRLVQTIPL